MESSCVHNIVGTQYYAPEVLPIRRIYDLDESKYKVEPPFDIYTSVVWFSHATDEGSPL